MYDINTKNVKKGKKIFLFFLIVGIIFMIIIGKVVFSNILKYKSLDASILSTKVEINSYYNDEGTLLYEPTYYYNVNGKDYFCTSSTSSSINPGTNNKTVYYDSKNPTNCLTEYSKSNNIFLLIFMILPIIFIFIGIINMIKINKRVRIINELNQKGKLIKNLKYHLENSDITINNVKIQRLVVDYKLPSGSIITLYGDPRYDKKSFDSDGLVDLVIDESNPDNYFIDFEINRISGNLPSDYYDEKNNID